MAETTNTKTGQSALLHYSYSIMTENIELKSFSNNCDSEDEIEEYHEIDEAYQKPKPTLQHRTSRVRTPTISEDDFFIHYDVKSVDKRSGKKKKSKKKESTVNLMDIINSELASLSLPISEHLVTTTVDYSVMQNRMVLKNPGITSLFKKPFGYLPENGYGDKFLTASLSPVYPKVLENTVSEYQPIPVQYIEAARFEDVVALHDPEEKSSKFLDFTIKNIRFTYHHEFCLEELLSNKLVECFNEYKAIERSLSELAKDIKVIRETRDSLKDDILKISAKKENVRFDETIRKYSLKLFILKDKYLEMISTRKECMHKIGSLWSDIITAREKSKSTKTPYFLDIERTEKNSEDFETEWSETFNIECADKLDRLEYDYVSEYVEYKRAKDNKTNTKNAKPKLDLDEENVKVEAEAITNKLVPKENIDIILRQEDKLISNKKQSRKSHPKKSYFFNIYVDDAFVCESETYKTKPADKLNVNFTESFSVQIFKRNKTVTIELHDQGESITYLKFHLSDVKGSSANNEFRTEAFVYNNIVEPNIKHIGSGYKIKEIAAASKLRLKSSNLFKGNLYTTCEISLQLGWNNKFSENEAESIKSSMEIGKQLKRLMHGVAKPNLDNLKDIIESIYEREIGDDADMIETLAKISKINTFVDDTIPIDENSPEFVRLKLLHLRNNGGFTNVENKTVPLLASQISTEQLNCLQKSTKNEFEVQYYERQDMDPIEIQRYIGVKYVEKLNKNMLRNLSEHLLKKTHKDVVRDFKDITLRGLFSSRTTLRLSLSTSMRLQRLLESLSQEQEIRVTVFRALGLRDRSPVVTDNDDDDEKIAGFKVRPLRPFIRISYQKQSVQTASAIGCHPTWNQTLKIKTKLTPLSCIHVNVFDEHRTPVTDSTDQSFGTLHYRCQNKWLGCLQVPVKAVLEMGMIKGTFKVSSPPVVLGYENTTKSTHSLIPEVTQLMRKDATFVSLQITTSLSHLGGGQGYYQPVPTDPDDYIIHHLNTFVTEYVNEFPPRNISLAFIDSTGHNKSVTHFLQPIPTPDFESFPKNPKSGSAMSKSSGFSSSSRKKEDERMSEGESIYSGFSVKGEGVIRMVDGCLRYVSLIPCYEAAESHVVTLLGVELLKVLHGSPLDHAILLASYFLHLGLKCYIASGFGLPRGQSYYVLTKYDIASRRLALANDLYRSRGIFSRNDEFIWYVYDAVNGERFELRDVSCPLKSVEYVFDNENIWVNMQSSVECENVSFDFTKSSEWKPVFDKSVFIMKLPVVTDTSLYSSPVDVENLRIALEMKIKSKVQQWRPHIKTIWNRYCSTLLRESLPFWEYHSFNPSEQKPGLGQRLKQLLLTHKIFGFPLNLPYTNTRSILARVKATGTHVSGDPNAEFALGLEVYAYPNGVLSVWVFLATIARI